MKRVQMQLTMTVTYTREDDQPLTDGQVRQLRRNLEYIPQHAAGIGALTDDAGEAVVDSFDYHVTNPKEIA
jgi:hypothetical protein